MNKRVLVLAPQPFFTARGTPFSVYHRTVAMARQGLRIDLLTYGQGEEVDIPGTTIHRIPAFGVRKLVKPGPSLLKFMFDIPLSLWTLARLFRHRYDIVHAHEEYDRT